MFSKVYVLTDEQSRIIRCVGGYTTPADLSGWVQIDEGTGDHYNLGQPHYFEGGLHTEDGIPRYKLEDGKAVARTEEEIAAIYPALAGNKTTPADLTGWVNGALPNCNMNLSDK